MKKLREIILRWLFGTDNIEKYIELLCKSQEELDRHLSTINSHLETLKESKRILKLLEQTIEVCKEHGIDIEEEIEY